MESNNNDSHSPTQWNENGDSSRDEEGDDCNDAEGVWSPDIEQSFLESLSIYPPCGRRKIILSEEGKMYGRNELIARYIKLRTGKTRTRKQVSSHIQVLARRKAKEIQANMKIGMPDEIKQKTLQTLNSMSSAQIVSASAVQQKMTIGSAYGPLQSPRNPYSTTTPSTFWQSGLQSLKPDGLLQPYAPYSAAGFDSAAALAAVAQAAAKPIGQADLPVPWGHGRCIAGPKLRLVEFSAYIESEPRSTNDHASYHKHSFVHIGADPGSYHPFETIEINQIFDKFPDKNGLRDLYDKGPPNAFYLVKFWADINTTLDKPNSVYAVDSHYESIDEMTISCSTKACSFGKQVVEKVETEKPTYEDGRYVYRIRRSQMCEYMINFVVKLKTLPEKNMMNSVLENFTILQVVTNRDTSEILLCIAFVFEISDSEHGSQHHIYRLVNSSQAPAASVLGGLASQNPTSVAV